MSPMRTANTPPRELASCQSVTSLSMEAGSLYVGGEWVAPVHAGALDVVSPHTEEIIAQAPAAGPDDVDRAVAAGRAAIDQGPWPRLDPAERIDAVRRLAAAY